MSSEGPDEASQPSEDQDVCYQELPPPQHFTTPMLLQATEYLQASIDNHDVILQAEGIELSEEEDVEKLIESIAGLQKKLHTHVTELACKELLAKRLQLSGRLLAELFPPDGVPAEEQEPVREKLKALVLKQSDLASRILVEHNEIEENRPKLEELKQKNFEFTQENRRLMSKLKERQESQSNKAKKFSENPEVEMAREKVEKLLWRMELQRNTLQGLVLGSGVNWAQDPDITSMLLDLGRPPDI